MVSFRVESAPNVHYARSASLVRATLPVDVAGTSHDWSLEMTREVAKPGYNRLTPDEEMEVGMPRTYGLGAKLNRRTMLAGSGCPSYCAGWNFHCSAA